MLSRSARRLLWSGMFVVFGIGALVSLIGVELVDMIVETGLLPPEEFAPARFLYANQPISRLIVLGCALVFSSFAAGLWRSSGPPARVGLLIAVAGQVLANLHATGALVTMLGLFMVFLSQAAVSLEEHPARANIAAGTQALTDRSVRELLAGWPALLGVPMVAGLLIVTIEFTVQVWPTTAAFTTASEQWRFLALSLSAGVLMSVRLAVELFLMLLVARALMRGVAAWQIVLLGGVAFSVATAFEASWWLPALMVVLLLMFAQLLRFRPHAAVRLLGLTLVTGLYIYARCLDLGELAVGRVVDEVRVGWALPVLFGAFVLPMTMWTQSGLVRAFSVDPPRSAGGVVRALALALFVPAGRRSLVAVILVAVFWAWFFRVINYPEFYDFATEGSKAYVPIAYLAAVVFVVSLYGRLPAALRFDTRGGRVAVVTVLLAAGVGYASLSNQSVPRLLAAQFAPMANEGVRWTQIWPERWHQPDAAEPIVLERQPRYPGSAPFEEERPPIIMILWDGARPDRMGLYGYERDTTPRAAELAAQAVVFDNAYSSSTATSISLRHLFSGRYSSRWATDPRHDPFFTGRLVELGYDQIIVNVPGSDLNGVGPGAFVRNQKDIPRVEAATVPFSTYEEPEKVERALALLDQRKSDRFFMFVHFLGPHFPWDHHEEVPTFGEDKSARYDESIAYTDHYTGQFFDGLRQRGLYDKAIIVLTSDHGTGLYDHGRWGGFLPYVEQLRVPLLMKVPGVAPRRVDAPVVGMDLAPTLVSLFDRDRTNPYHGFSLQGLLSGEPIDRRYLFHVAQFRDAYAVTDTQTNERLTWFRRERYFAYYDLNTDPREQRNLADERPEAVERLHALVRGWLALGAGHWDVPYLYRADDDPPLPGL